MTSVRTQTKAAALLAAFALALAALWASAQPATALAADLAAGSLDGAAATQVETQSTYEYLDSAGKITISDRTAGTATYNESTKTITLNGVKAKALSINIQGGSFTLVMNGASSLQDLFSYSSLTVKGAGSLAISESLDAFDNSVLTMTQGTISGQVFAGKLTMTGGKIMGSGVTAKISARNGLVMSGGTIALSSPKYTGISVTNGDFTMTGGTLSVLNAGSSGVDVSHYATTSSPNTGKITITGGSLSITVKAPTTSYAMYAASMSNPLGCFKTLQGRLPFGAQFTVGNNLYQVMKLTMDVKLMQYNGKAKKVKVNKVSFGGYNYEVGGIGAGAFNTKAGKKVTSIALNSYITEIGAKAFANTKALKKLTFKYMGWMKRVYDAKYNLKKVKVDSASVIAKKAFTKCGKNGGKSLTVVIGRTGVWHKEAAKYKKLLRSRGMSKSAKLKTY